MNEMSIWSQLQGLPEEAQQQVHMAYGERFPIEVRCALAEWIEDKPWEELDPCNANHKNYASTLVMALINEIESRANTEDNFIMRYKLSQSAQNFRQNYSHNPFMLVSIVKHCLNTEAKVIQSSQNYLNITNPEIKPQIRDPNQEMTLQLEKQRKQTMQTEEELRRMHQEQEQLIIELGENHKILLIIQQLKQSGGQNIELFNKWQKEKDSSDNELRLKAKSLMQKRMSLIDKHQETLAALQALQQQVLDDELIRWKRAQQLCGNGVPFDDNLDQIQEWCEALAELIWHNRQQIKRVESLRQKVPLNSSLGLNDRLLNLNKQITSLLSNLVKSAFIIEKQPPQVMKTNTRFTSTVRSLVGGKLNLHMTRPQVNVSIISEAQVNSMLKNGKVSIRDVSGEILNNNGTMEYHSASGQLSVSFRNMQLKKIKRTEKQGIESVMDEKFALLFQSQLKVGEELVFQVWTLSLPVVVVVHGNQEPQSWATVVWDNAFAVPGRTGFAVPDKVPFSQVAQVLSQKFVAAVGRGLGEHHLRFLAGKAFRDPYLRDYNNSLLSWSLFNKELLPDRNFTFWEWFYAILKVTREHFRELWKEGSVMGFVGRQHAEEMLSIKMSGTFLLRYSDSELGGVTVAWVRDGQEAGEVYMLQPFTSRDFAVRGLADRINDLKHLTNLYPDVPKDQAFSKYYTLFNGNRSSTSKDYVKSLLVTVVPGIVSSFDCNPNTLQTTLFNSHSPADTSLLYPDNPLVQSSSNVCPINVVGMTTVDDCADLMSMDPVSGDMDIPVDISSINVSDLWLTTNPHEINLLPI